ncbi:MAG TPA: hypothetical protein VGE40_07775 [Bacilli bacterium]
MFIILIMLGAGLVWFVYPEEKLDLTYSNLSITGKISEMLKKRKFEITLTEQEVGDLIKKQLILSNAISPEFQIKGARFELESNLLTAYMNLSYMNMIDIGTVTYFELTWNDPNVTAAYQRTEVKRFVLPTAWLMIQSIEIPVTDLFPSVLGVGNMAFEKDSVRISFKLNRMLPPKNK